MIHQQINKSTPLTLHKFTKQDVKKSVFLNNLNSLAWFGRYKIWLTRDDPPFHIPQVIPPLSVKTFGKPDYTLAHSNVK